MLVQGFSRPNVVISKCLEFDKCRYNGDMVGNAFVRKLKESGSIDFVPVCMECEIGLGVPRAPIRIVQPKGGRKTLIQPATGRDVTDQAVAFSERFLTDLPRVDGFILKSRSPSCGIHDTKIFPAAENSVALMRQSGLFGEAVRRSFPDLPVEDEMRLGHVKLAEHFLTCIFTHSTWREVENKGEMRDLIDFHSDHKLLLMMYSQKELKSLGNILANRERKELEEVKEDYRIHLRAALLKPPRCNSGVNVLQHAFGYFSDRLKAEERKFFMQQLDMYRDARIPFSVCLNLMRSWIIRFDEPYLGRQRFFDPFPEDLLEVGVTDSCEWRDLSS
jgi:uncharacterized protein YbgA (DUF1722 family)/uncharacterized protein YbbK (DUF523 family)